MPKEASSVNNEENQASNSILDLITKSSLTADGKKVIENWSRHWKTSNYGKRTGKPVSILKDVKSLFPSSSNSSLNCSNQDLENRQSPINVSYNMDQTSLNHNDLGKSDELILTNTKFIKRRLSFSKNSSSPKNQTQLENFKKKSSNDKQKNSTIVTVLNDISNPNMPITSEFDAFENEQSACDSQFVCVPSDKQLENSTKSSRRVYSKKSALTTTKRLKNKPVFDDSSLHQSNNFQSHSCFSTKVPEKVIDAVSQTPKIKNHNLTKTKLSTARKRIADSLISANSQKKHVQKNSEVKNSIEADLPKDSENASVKGLRSWLSTTVSSGRHNALTKENSLISNVQTADENCEVSNAQEHLSKKDVPCLSVVLEDIAASTNQTFSKTPAQQKALASKTLHQPLFEVDASTIAGITFDGALNRLKPGPPMSTPRQVSTIEEFGAAKKVADNTPAVLTKPADNESDESIGVDSEKASSVCADDDTYAESQPVFVYENNSDKNENTFFSSQSKTVDQPKTQENSLKRKKASEITKNVKSRETKKKKLKSNTSELKTISEDKLVNATSTNTTSTSKVKNKAAGKNISSKKGKNTKTNAVAKKDKSVKQSYFQRHYCQVPPPKLIVPKPSPEALQKGLRRSRRARVRPLQTWFGEKMVYGDNEELLGLQTTSFFQPVSPYEKLELSFQKNKSKTKRDRFSNCLGELDQEPFVSPTKAEVPSTSSKNQKTKIKKKKSAAKKKKVVVDNNGSLQKSVHDSSCPNQDPAAGSTTIQIIQNDQGTVVEASSLIAIPENEVFMGRNGKKYEAGEPLRFSKGISTSQLAMGTITIFPGEEKSLSKMKTDTLCFYVAEGYVEVTLESAVTSIPSKSYFCIPPLNSYNIKNLSKKEPAFLFFTQIKNRSQLKV